MNNVKNWENFNESDMIPGRFKSEDEIVNDNLWIIYKHNSFDFYHHVMNMLTLEQKKELLKKINQGRPSFDRSSFGRLKRESVILENFTINENSVAFNVSVGRANYGFQRACYDGADLLGLDIDIRRMGGLLSVEYRIKLTGDQDKIDRFIEWIKSIET